ncbi:prepilin peptidase [Rhodococcus artemisiae]|uniref:Prepilin peptidase n=1 Tax=Rhodococcus artemisiae TaxID=714159 RepID=A0ABU7L3T2_9NOCA|nr:prepilin peptidase [Rhodococcus artemisiae]MEE2056210.1 prepilin peptidase [Rhodococcus artemisiae]
MIPAVVMSVVMALLGAVVGVCVRKLTARLSGADPWPGACEVACAVGGTLAVMATWPSTTALALLMWWCVCCSGVDVLVQRLPNVLTLGGGLAVVTIGACAGHGRAAAVGAAMLTAVMLTAHLLFPRSLGAGDVKLAIGLGGAAGVAGAQAWMIALLLPPLLTAVVGSVVLLYRRIGRVSSGGRSTGSTVVPHGPSMCVATVLAVLSAG